MEHPSTPDTATEPDTTTEPDTASTPDTATEPDTTSTPSAIDTYRQALVEIMGEKEIGSPAEIEELANKTLAGIQITSIQPPNPEREKAAARELIEALIAQIRQKATALLAKADGMETEINPVPVCHTPIPTSPSLWTPSLIENLEGEILFGISNNNPERTRLVLTTLVTYFEIKGNWEEAIKYAGKYIEFLAKEKDQNPPTIVEAVQKLLELKKTQKLAEELALLEEKLKTELRNQNFRTALETAQRLKILAEKMGKPKEEIRQLEQTISFLNAGLSTTQTTPASRPNRPGSSAHTPKERATQTTPTREPDQPRLSARTRSERATTIRDTHRELLRENQFQEAVAFIQKALESDSSNKHIFNLLIGLKLAMKILKDPTEIDRSSANSLVTASFALEYIGENGEMALAIKCLERVLEIGLKSNDHLVVNKTLSRLERLKERINPQDTQDPSPPSIPPTIPPQLLREALTARNKGEYDKALACARRYLEMQIKEGLSLPQIRRTTNLVTNLEAIVKLKARILRADNPQVSPAQTAPAEPTPSEPPAEPTPSEPPAEPTPSEPPAEPTPSEPPAEPTPSEPPAAPTPSEPPAEELPTPERERTVEDLREELISWLTGVLKLSEKNKWEIRTERVAKAKGKQGEKHFLTIPEGKTQELTDQLARMLSEVPLTEALLGKILGETGVDNLRGMIKNLQKQLERGELSTKGKTLKDMLKILGGN